MFARNRGHRPTDGGKTWQTLAISAHRGFWLTMVHDPASGYVALRSTVTDSHGDSSVQTNYGAYSISAP